MYAEFSDIKNTTNNFPCKAVAEVEHNLTLFEFCYIPEGFIFPLTARLMVTQSR